MSGFRGHGQERRGPQIGPVSQRQLVKILSVLIDTARSRGASKTRDDARRALRDLMTEANWNTPYVTRNIGARRCRYLIGLGYKVPIEAATRSDIDRLEQWSEQKG